MFGARQQAELQGELERLRAQVAELEGEKARGARMDPATGLFSLRSFRARLTEEVTRALRYQRPVSVAILAIEDFDAIEVKHGFKAADDLLIAVARRLAQGIRSQDLVGRTGAGEFGILLPDTPATDALGTLEGLIGELEKAGEAIVSGITVSLGIAGLEREMTPETLLAHARDACAHAEGKGGGQAKLASAQPAAEEARRGPMEAVEALAVALTERDRYTGEHSEAVIEMSASVARNLGLRDAEVDRIRSAALLHDIGKVAIPDEILNKPGPLTDR